MMEATVWNLGNSPFSCRPFVIVRSITIRVPGKPIVLAKVVFVFTVSTVVGVFVGVAYPFIVLAKVKTQSDDMTIGYGSSFKEYNEPHRARESAFIDTVSVFTNRQGAKSVPPGIVASETDLYMHRSTCQTEEDLHQRQKYLVAFAVGIGQKYNIDSAVRKFSGDFQVMLFHYDGHASDWDQFDWSKNVIHVSTRKQTKWWYAKRFLHPNGVAAYEYVFIWDEDLGVEHFNANMYIDLMKKHGLEIAQPGIEYDIAMSWGMTIREENSEVHKFVEIMAPVFSRDAWRCVWHMIQNDLVHGWGLDFAIGRCVQLAHEKIGVVDSRWIVHQKIPSLWDQVWDRCEHEWAQF